MMALLALILGLASVLWLTRHRSPKELFPLIL